MHIPDGFIDAKTAVTTAALSAAGVGLALRQVRRGLPRRRVPLLGLAAAFLFAAQMVNFPVYGGTSGHLMGGVLVAALLGPSAAIVVLTTVLIVQCFLFADGGVLALGANIFNMAIAGAAGGYGIYRLVNRALPGPRGRVAAIAFAGWCSTVLASVFCAGQLAWSGTVAWPAAFTAMAGVHMLIGVGEGLIGALAFLAIQRVRPDLAGDVSDPEQPGLWSGFARYGLLVAVGLAGVIQMRRTALGVGWFQRLPQDQRLDELAFRFMALALIFNGLMLVAGAIWAQDAWGRYWAWDPLETWAFITWLLLAVALHVRVTFRLSPRLSSAMAFAVFVIAFLTFFGVPFLSSRPHQGTF